MGEWKHVSSEFERELREQLVTLYFRYGSVDEVMRLRPNSGLSYAELHRELDGRGIIKIRGAKGRSLPHTLFFFLRMLGEKVPLQELYRSMPQSFKKLVSIATLHRVHQYIKRQIDGTLDRELKREYRMYGTALVLVHPDDKGYILVGNDVSPPSDKYGKRYGAVTIPIGFSGRNRYRDGILRIFQQEVATPLAVRGDLGSDSELTLQIIPEHPEPFMHLDIANVRVAAHAIRVPKSMVSLPNFESFKLRDYSWVQARDISMVEPSDPDFRAGIVDIVSTYNQLLEGTEIALPVKRPSWLNLQVANLALTR